MKGVIFVGVFLCTNVVSQVIPGLSPSKPNRLLKTCISQSASTNSTLGYNNQPANSINIWCQSYKNALPCTTKYLPNAIQSNPNDWYLSLVYDEEYATKTSRSICTRLKKYGNKMGCLTSEMNQAEMCVRMLTSPIAEYIHKSYQLNQTVETEPNENSLRACLIPVTASRCFKPFFKRCRKGIRKLLARYFMILSGKCLKIVKEHKKSETSQPDSSPTISQTSMDNDEEEDITTRGGNIDNTEDQTEGQFDERRSDYSRNTYSQNDHGIKESNHFSTLREKFEQTTPRGMKFSNMKMIQRVIESDSQIEPDMTSSRISHGTFIQTHQLSNIHDRFIGVRDHLEFVRPTSTFPPKPIAEDIYIPNSQILSAMTTLSKQDIEKPNEEKEAGEILSVYSNDTESDSSDSRDASPSSESEDTSPSSESQETSPSSESQETSPSSESEGTSPSSEIESTNPSSESTSPPNESTRSSSESEDASSSSERVSTSIENESRENGLTSNDSGNGGNDSESTSSENEREDSDSDGSDSVIESNASSSADTDGESNVIESESSEEEMTMKTTLPTTTEKVIVSTTEVKNVPAKRTKAKNIPAKTTKGTRTRGQSERQLWSGDSNGLTVVYNKVTIVTLTFISLMIQNFYK